MAIDMPRVTRTRTLAQLGSLRGPVQPNNDKVAIVKPHLVNTVSPNRAYISQHTIKSTRHTSKGASRINRISSSNSNSSTSKGGYTDIVASFRIPLNINESDEETSTCDTPTKYKEVLTCAIRKKRSRPNNGTATTTATTSTSVSTSTQSPPADEISGTTREQTTLKLFNTKYIANTYDPDYLEAEMHINKYIETPSAAVRSPSQTYHNHVQIPDCPPPTQSTRQPLPQPTTTHRGSGDKLTSRCPPGGSLPGAPVPVPMPGNFNRYRNYHRPTRR